MVEVIFSMRLKKFLPKRNPWSHKGQYGSVLIVAGSEKYTGSPIFNGLAALRSGSDLATLIGHSRAMEAATSTSPDLITIPLCGELKPSDTKNILSIQKDYDILIIGGGLARSKDTYEAIRKLIKGTKLPIVIDAEAIRAVGKSPIDLLKNKKAILTPHEDEFFALTGERVSCHMDTRKKKVKKWAKKLGVTILLKGHIDIISDGITVHENRTGSVYMTKGGFGDILSGICGSFLATGISPYEAAKAAAYICGKAGEEASKRYGPGVLASDAITFIPIAG